MKIISTMLFMIVISGCASHRDDKAVHIADKVLPEVISEKYLSEYKEVVNFDVPPNKFRSFQIQDWGIFNRDFCSEMTIIESHYQGAWPANAGIVLKGEKENHWAAIRLYSLPPTFDIQGLKFEIFEGSEGYTSKKLLKNGIPLRKSVIFSTVFTADDTIKITVDEIDHEFKLNFKLKSLSIS